MPVDVGLWGAGALLGVTGLALAAGRLKAGSALVYGASLLICAVALASALGALIGGAGESERVLPLGLPWLGAQFRIDALAAFFLIVVNLGGAATSLYALGYGRHEAAPMRVLPFFPAFLAAMNLVVLADDAFTFLFAWEFMSLTSWALVMAHHRERDNARAGYVYFLMASFGTLALLLAFGALAGQEGDYAFAVLRASSGHHTAAVAALVLVFALLGAGERRHDQGRNLQLRASRLRPSRRAELVVEHDRAGAGRRYRRFGRALCADGARSEAAPRLSHRREYRHHFHRPRPCAGLSRQRRRLGGGTGADRGALPCAESLALQEPLVLRRGRGAERDRRARHGASWRPHPSHEGDERALSRRLRCDLGAAALERLRLRMAHLPGDPRQPRFAAMGAEDPYPRHRRAACLGRGARRSLLRQGFRRHLSRPAALRGRAQRQGGRPVLHRGHGAAGDPVPRCRRGAGIGGRRSLSCRRVAGAGADAKPGGDALAVAHPDRGEPKLL